MQKDEHSSHIDDIINAIKDKDEKKVSRGEVEKEFSKFMEYGVPADQAKQTLIKKYGGTAVIPSSSSSIRKLISDLKPNEFSVKLLGHVIAVNPKEINVKGEPRTIYYGILGDESGTIPFTAWNNLELEKGDVVEITNAYTREFQGAAQLNFGDRVKIEKTEKERLPEDAFKPHKMKVKDLRSGIGRVDVTARIINIQERETEVDGEKKKVFSGIIADETGKAQFTSWHDFKIKEDEVLQINGGYVKSWKGIPQLTFDSNATVKKLDKKSISKKELATTKMPLHQLIEKGGALDVEVEGTVIDIRPSSGLVMRCPECNRVLINDQCSIHNEVKGIPDLRIKLILDDGTGAVDSVLNKELSEKILELSFNDIKKMKPEDLEHKIHNKIFTRHMVIKGNALSDNFGTTIIPKDAGLVEFDVEKESQKILEGLGEIL